MPSIDGGETWTDMRSFESGPVDDPATGETAAARARRAPIASMPVRRRRSWATVGTACRSRAYGAATVPGGEALKALTVPGVVPTVEATVL